MRLPPRSRRFNLPNGRFRNAVRKAETVTARRALRPRKQHRAVLIRKTEFRALVRADLQPRAFARGRISGRDVIDADGAAVADGVEDEPVFAVRRHEAKA